MPIELNNEIFLTSKQICARYSRSQMTIWRWANNPEIRFPTPMVVNGLKLYPLSGLLEFEARQVANGSETTRKRQQQT